MRGTAPPASRSSAANCRIGLFMETLRDLETVLTMDGWRTAIDEVVDSLREMLREVRRRLHANPEPSRQEYETTRFLAEQLEKAGISRAIAPTGRGLITGSPTANGELVIAFRADIDALRIHDAKAVAYRSTCDGVMHACGHDAHAAMALGAALALWRCREVLPHGLAWRTIFQPSEEVGEGALEMIAAGAMSDVQAVIALHVDPETAAGRLGYRQGVLTAFCQELHVEIKGQGGHAARRTSRSTRSASPRNSSPAFTSSCRVRSIPAIRSWSPLAVSRAAPAAISSPSGSCSREPSGP